MSFAEEIKLFTVKLLIAIVIIGTFWFLGTILTSTLLIRSLQPTIADAEGRANALMAQLDNMSPEEVEKTRKRVAVFVQKSQPVIKEFAPIIEELRPLFSPAVCPSPGSTNQTNSVP